MRNRTPWNKGKAWSVKIRNKLSKSQKKRFDKESVWNKGLLGYRAGKESHLWKGGISFKPYGVEFTRELKEKIRERDGRRCRQCNYSEKELGRK